MKKLYKDHLFTCTFTVQFHCINVDKKTYDFSVLGQPTDLT